jgi:transcriptional regulator with XRE-family HTH domain
MATTTLAERLKSARKAAGLSQEDLAKSAGIAQSTIGNIEAGTRKRPREVVALATVLNVAPHWLVTGDGSMVVGESPVRAEWPFEFISRAQWHGLTERERGAVEAAALHAYQLLPRRLGKTSA